jgi:transposase
MEATQGAHYWARVIGSFGHQVRLIAPQFVKPYLKGQKNDPGDAAAICEAVSRPEMRFVPQKSIEQQDLQALHRIRSRLIGCRTQLGNQIRGLLAEYGIILPQDLSQIRMHLPTLFSVEHPLLSSFARGCSPECMTSCALSMNAFNLLKNGFERFSASNDLCQKIAAVEGVGPIIATAIVAAVADGRTFRNGRQFAAWHGARSVLYRCGTKTDNRSRWITEKKKTLGTTKACVAVANKNARIIWALVARDEPYRAAA